MLKMFLISRYDDTVDLRDRIIDQIHERYGPNSLVSDVRGRSLPEYLQQVRSEMSHCRVALVLIWPMWTLGRDTNGYRLIDNPYDPVRVEIREALAQRRLIVPLLLHRASMPHIEELPPDIAPLALRQGFPVRNDPEFAEDMRTAYRQINTQLAWRPASLFVLGAAASAGLALITSYATADLTFGTGQQEQAAIGAIIFSTFLVSLLIVLAAGTATVLLSIARRSWGWLAAACAGLLLLAVVASLPVQGEQAQSQQLLFLFPLILLNVFILVLFGFVGPRREAA